MRYAAGYAASGIRDGAERVPPALPSTIHPIWHIPPSRPYDLFLIAAYLLDASGAYHHIQPERESDTTDCTRGEHAPTPDHVRHVAITKADRDVVYPAAAAWRRIPWKHHQWYAMDDLAAYLTRSDIWTALEPLFESWFIVFGAYADRPVFGRRPAERDSAYPAPCWWFHAWRLLAIADEAAKGTGFKFDWNLITETEVEDDRMPWFERLLWLHAIGEYEPGESPRDFTDILRPESFAFGRREIGCVLPKVRTPAIGCTLRSLSHHLALLPANGVARGKWSPALATTSKQQNKVDRPSDQMNLLLVPFPYSIDPKSFCGRVFEKADDGKPAYGYFDVHQDWLTEDPARREQVVELVSELVIEANKHSTQIHGVVFPELSLDLETYTMVRNHLLKVAPDLELFVAGISDNQKKRKGNFVAVSSFRDAETASGSVVEGTKRRLLHMSVRDKHHRWKLDGEQLRSYGLMGVLSPEIAWWENIDLLSRRVDFSVIRPELVVSALIVRTSHGSTLASCC